MLQKIKNEMLQDYIYDGWGLTPEAFQSIFDNWKEGSTILEFGSGQGTRILSKKYKMISIEDDINFINKYNSIYLHVPLIKYTKDIFPIDYDIFNEDQHWFNPIELKSKLTDLQYDYILLDGPKGYRGGILSYLDLFDFEKPVLVDDTHDFHHNLMAEKIGSKYNKKVEKFTTLHPTPSGIYKSHTLLT